MQKKKVEFTKAEIKTLMMALDHFCCEGYTIEWLRNGEIATKKFIEDDALGHKEILDKLEVLYEAKN